MKRKGNSETMTCDVCNMVMPVASWNQHLSGKKHVSHVERRRLDEEKAERSIYVSKLPDGASELMLIDYFMQFAPVASVIWDKNRGKFAIIEFQTFEGVKTVLSQRHQLENKFLIVQPRRRGRQPSTSRTGEQKKSGKEREKPNEPAVLQQLQMKENVEQQIQFLIHKYALSEVKALRRINTIRNQLQELFKNFFPNCELFVYGSCANGLAIINSDVDLYLNVNCNWETESINDKDGSQTELLNSLTEKLECFRTGIDPTFLSQVQKMTTKSLIQLIACILKKYAKDCYRVISILSAKCPIVQFSHSVTKCDLSISNWLAIHNTSLIRLLQRVDARVYPLLFTIRYWAKQNGLCNSPKGRLSSYAVAMLVIFYLQNCGPPILPTVEELQSLTDSSLMCSGWECCFCTDETKIPKSRNLENLESLLFGFFKFYSSLDITQHVLSIRTGKCVPKSQFMKSVSADERLKTFKMGAIAIQDPFELAFNVTGSLTDVAVIMFLEIFEKAYKCISDTREDWGSPSNKPWGLAALMSIQFNNRNTPEVKPLLKFKTTLLSQPETVTSQSEASLSQSEMVTSLSEVSTLSQPEASSLSQSEVSQPQASSLSEPEVSTLSQPETASLSQSDVPTLLHPEASSLSQSEVSTLLQPKTTPVTELQTSSIQNYIEFELALRVDISQIPPHICVWNSEVNYLNYVCHVIRDIFSTALKFVCADVDIPQEGVRECEESLNKRRKLDESFSVPLTRFRCTAFYRSWCSRKQGRKILLTLPCMDVLTSEAKVSEHIISEQRRPETAAAEPSKPILDFICVVYKNQQSPTPALTVQFQPIETSKELRTAFSSFIKSYLSKVTNQIIEQTFHAAYK